MLRHLALALGFCWCGCFRGVDAVKKRTHALPSVELEVRDQSDAIWEATSAPRSPVFVLRFDGPRTKAAESHLFLLRGAASEDVLQDLQSATLRGATQLALLELELEPGAGLAQDVRARPARTLDPGARYTLIWAEPEGTKEFRLAVSESPAAGARLVQSSPAELDARVPLNLQRALLRFDGYLQGDPELVQLRDQNAELIASTCQLLPCAELGLPLGDCIELTPAQVLAPLMRYSITVQAGLNDATGAALPTQTFSFSTAPSRDEKAPAWRSLGCAADEVPMDAVCVLASDTGVTIRARADENGQLWLAVGSKRVAALGLAGDYTLELALGGQATGVLTLEDLAGNSSSALALALGPALDLARVSIDEVRVDPLGPEPAQEYVELLNFGPAPVSLHGFTITSDTSAAGPRILGDVALAPGERVLVVAPDFDPSDEHDAELAAGVRIARLERGLSLRNDGAALFLRDAASRRLSAAPALAPERAGQCIVRVGSDARSGHPRAFAPAANGSCTPGYASDP